jgi:hypothetical protein
MDIMQNPLALFAGAVIFVAMGVYQLKTGKLLGGRSGTTKTFLAYPYGLLFVAVGAVAVYQGCKVWLEARAVVASCNERSSQRQCVEHTSGTLDQLRATCPHATTDRCATDNLVGKCRLPDRTEYIYSDLWERKPDVEQPRCEAAGGSWSR